MLCWVQSGGWLYHTAWLPSTPWCCFDTPCRGGPTSCLRLAAAVAAAAAALHLLHAGWLLIQRQPGALSYEQIRRFLKQWAVYQVRPLLGVLSSATGWSTHVLSPGLILLFFLTLA